MGVTQIDFYLCTLSSVGTNGCSPYLSSSANEKYGVTNCPNFSELKKLIIRMHNMAQK